MNRRDFLQLAALGGAQVLAANPSLAASARRAPGESSRFRIRPFELEEATIADFQAAMQSGKESALSLAKKYLRRIEELDQRGPTLRAILEINPDALVIARSLDHERKAKGPRGPLHGIPVLLKDNIDTHDRMTTTAGSLALLGSIPPRDSFVAQKLREAGAIVLGKANLSEWANFRGDHSSSGWSGRGGQTNNPVRVGSESVGFKLRFRCRGRGELMRGRNRHGDGWLDHFTFGALRHCGHQADCRAGEPFGNYSDFEKARTPPARWHAR